MDLLEGLMAFDRANPGQRSALKQISTALRRRGIDTVAHMAELYRQQPEALLKIRGIGPARLQIIGEVLQFYGAMEENFTENSAQKMV